MLQQQRAIVNCMAVNEDGVLASGGDNGSLWMWDWRSGNVFQQQDSIVQPGSLDSEAGIYDMSYDMSGSRWVAVCWWDLIRPHSCSCSCLHIYRLCMLVALQQ
jgi:WD40 repeat protein